MDLNKDIDQYIEENNIEFLDLGASKGGSIDFAQKYFCIDSGNGLGIDIDQSKILIMKKAGYNAFHANVIDLQLENKVRFTIMSHFLEHISNMDDVANILDVTADNSRDFFYIQQPFFDADGFLFSKGLKFYWSFWTGHPNHMLAIEFHQLLMKMLYTNKISRYALYGFKTVCDSTNEKIHPLMANIDEHDYDSKKHPPKDMSIIFPDEIDVFFEIRVLVTINDNVDFDILESQFQWDKKLYDSSHIK